MQNERFTIEETRQMVEKMEDVVLDSIIYTVQQRGVLNDAATIYNFKEILDRLNCQQQYCHIINRWIKALVQRGRIKPASGDGYYGTSHVTEELVEQKWDEARKMWDYRFGSPLVMEYWYMNFRNLLDLIKGKTQAVFLLFPQGEDKYAKALYSDTKIAQYINLKMVDIIEGHFRAFCKESTDKLKILEIGGCTAATTEMVLKALEVNSDITKIEYNFSDISKFFLIRAKKIFEKYDFVKYRILDVDCVKKGLLFDKEKFDIVIAAGVLNNAYSIEATLAALYDILEEGGLFIFSEPIQESLEILISQAFMITKPKDIRMDCEETFMTKEQWEKVISNSGFMIKTIYPQEDEPMAVFGQRVFAVIKEN